MKTILTSDVTSTSKQPFLSPSLAFLQTASKEVISEIVKGILGSYTTNDVIIIEGCVLTGSDPGARTMSAGSIYYNGEIYLVDAASFTTTGSNIPLWTKISTFDNTIDPIVFSDGSGGHNVHQITKFVLTQGPSGGSGITGYIADYNASNVKYLSNLKTGTLTNLTMTNGFSGTGGPNAQYKKTLNGIVSLRGEITAPGTVTSNNFATLPSGYYPAYPVRFAVYSTTASALFVVEIDGGGSLSVTQSNGTAIPANAVFYLGGISFDVNS